VGDPMAEVRTVGVGWMATLDNLRAAHALGCQLFVTHEPTFWEHEAPEQRNRGIEPGLSKRRFLEDTGLVVLRAHDSWDNWPGIGIRDSWARGLGLTRFLAQDSTRWHAVYQIEETTLAGFAGYVAGKVRALGEQCVRVYGDPQMRVSRPSLGVGCGGPGVDMITQGSDVLIVCADGVSYWRDIERFLELHVGVIVVEDGTSEMWGIESLARHLGEAFPGLRVHYLDHHPRPWAAC
jgi:putative NIF3 family GTP cyclohydrolase 1 type 2